MYGNSCQVTNPVVADGVTEPLSPDALDLDQRHLRHVRHLGARIEVTDHARPCIPVIERDVGVDLAADDAPLERSHLERPLEGLVLLFGRKAEAGEGVDVRALQRADPADDRGGLDALFLDHVLEALEEEIIAFEDRQDDPRRALRHEVVHRRLRPSVGPAPYTSAPRLSKHEWYPASRAPAPARPPRRPRGRRGHRRSAGLASQRSQAPDRRQPRRAPVLRLLRDLPWGRWTWIVAGGAVPDPPGRSPERGAKPSRALSLRHHQAWRGAARAAGNAGLRVPPQ